MKDFSLFLLLVGIVLFIAGIISLKRVSLKYPKNKFGGDTYTQSILGRKILGKKYGKYNYGINGIIYFFCGVILVIIELALLIKQVYHINP